MKVYWTEESYIALRHIRDHISQDSDVFARRTIERILVREAQIGAFPQSGRKVPEYNNDDIREVFEGAYRIIFKINDDVVDVLTVVHGTMKRVSQE